MFVEAHRGVGAPPQRVGCRSSIHMYQHTHVDGTRLGCVRKTTGFYNRATPDGVEERRLDFEGSRLRPESQLLTMPVARACVPPIDTREDGG